MGKSLNAYTIEVDMTIRVDVKSDRETVKEKANKEISKHLSRDKDYHIVSTTLVDKGPERPVDSFDVVFRTNYCPVSENEEEAIDEVKRQAKKIVPDLVEDSMEVVDKEPGVDVV